MTRTDSHSPANFDPAEYDYIGSFDAWRTYPLPAPAAAIEDRLTGLLSTAGFPDGN